MEMKTIKSYIDESLFSGNEVDTDDVSAQLLLDEFKKYTSDSLKGHSIWDLGSVSADSKGIVIRFPDGHPENCLVTLSGLKGKKAPEFNIYRVTGCGTIEITGNDIETTEGIFSPNCKCDGHIRLNIYKNENLTSLAGCPKKIWYFACDENKKLDDWKGAPREADLWDYLDDYKGVPHTFISDKKLKRLPKEKRKEIQNQINFRKKEFKKYTNNKINMFVV